MSRAQVLEADWIWTGRAFESGLRLAVDEAGRIEAVGRLDRTATRRLPGRALLPGFVNAHSHAFQRGLRGHGERFPEGAGSFWSWREAMYGLVESLDPERCRSLCVQAFREMLAAGITTVGEFHYLHHGGAGADFGLDQAVRDAAREAGIRLVLLEAYYRTGGIGAPLGPAQRRFETAGLEAYWAQMDRLAATLDPARESLGAVAHSIRAATPDEIGALHAEAARRGIVFHIHVEEQRREIEESLAAYGRRPMALLNERWGEASNVTAVHCTHTDPADMQAFLARGGRVCVCPLTEANLGDGLPDLDRAHAAGGRLCLGTDSNARIAMLEEMRWLEYGQRLRGERRGALRAGDGAVSRALLDAATSGGAEALGVPAGRITPGAWADLVSVDLSAPALAGADEATLLDALVFGADASAIDAVCVGGDWQETRGG